MIRNIDFSKYSTIKIGSKIDVFVIEEVAKYNDLNIIGNASNLLISPEAKDLAILSKEFDYIEIRDNLLYVGAKCSNLKLFNFTKKNNIKNFEFLSQLPGSIGGSIKMNAGVKEYEIFNNLVAIKTNRGYIERSDINFGYRFADVSDIVFEAVFELEQGFNQNLVDCLRLLRANQPKEPSAGSCFKNPNGDFAGRLIEAVGLKGFVKNSVGFSEKHANFLVNLSNGVYKDAIFLIELAKRRVYEEFGIFLELEIVIF